MNLHNNNVVGSALGLRVLVAYFVTLDTLEVTISHITFCTGGFASLPLLVVSFFSGACTSQSGYKAVYKTLHVLIILYHRRGIIEVVCSSLLAYVL